jgi:2-acylglycerol O-acyltransferase 2
MSPRAPAQARECSPNPNTHTLEQACDFSDTLNTLKFTDYLAIFIWTGWFLILPSLPIVLLLFWLYRNSITTIPLLTTISIIFISMASPLDIKSQPKWGISIGKWCMKTAQRYFGLRLYFEDKKSIESCGPSIFAMEPHDVLPIGLFSFSDYLGYFKGHKNIGCLTGVCFKLPFMRNMYTWASATSVDKRNVKSYMDKGYSPTICPGGVQEVILMGQSQQLALKSKSKKKECVLYLKKRKGIVRLAMEYGRPIIPTFTFGLRKTWDFWIPTTGIAHWLGRKIGFVPMIFFGLFGIPFNISKPCSLTVVIGKPIYVPKFVPDEHGKFEDEDVDKYHDKLLSSMEQIFRDYKNDFDMADTTLRIE